MRSQGEHPLRVVVSIPPLAGLIRPILPEDAEVHILVPPGRTVHGYVPTPADMAEVARADLVVLVGLGLEGRLDDPARRSSGHVVTMSDVLGIKGEADDHHDHQAHDEPGHDEHEHHHGFVDPHLWLDPVLAARFVRELPGRLPENVRSQLHGVDDLIARINDIDEQYRRRLKPFAGRAIVTHHASMSRVASRYGLRVAAVLRSVESLEPTPADIAEARRAIEAEGVGTIFVEPQFSGATAGRLAESAGVDVVVLDPLGDGDWFAMMRTNLDHLVDGLSRERTEP